jgi:hypothetical protein
VSICPTWPSSAQRTFALATHIEACDAMIDNHAQASSGSLSDLPKIFRVGTEQTEFPNGANRRLLEHSHQISSTWECTRTCAMGHRSSPDSAKIGFNRVTLVVLCLAQRGSIPFTHHHGLVTTPLSRQGLPQSIRQAEVKGVPAQHSAIKSGSEAGLSSRAIYRWRWRAIEAEKCGSVVSLRFRCSVALLGCTLLPRKTLR